MIKITAWRNNWEPWFDTGHKENRNDAEILIHTEVTDQDHEKMMDKNTNDYVIKVVNILEGSFVKPEDIIINK